MAKDKKEKKEKKKKKSRDLAIVIDDVATVSTFMEMDKECKSCVRFRSQEVEEKVSSSIYIINPGWEALENPTKIKVSIIAVEEDDEGLDLEEE